MQRTNSNEIESENVLSEAKATETRAKKTLVEAEKLKAEYEGKSKKLQDALS